MPGSKISLFLCALIGVILWNMPSTISVYNGTHAYGNASNMCEKCHSEIYIEHAGSSEHNSFSCYSCHRSNTSITYQSRNISGREAHSVSKVQCTDCHLNISSGNTVTLSASPTITLEASTTTNLMTVI